MKLTLSENISKLRKQRNLTQEQLAEALGISFAAVSKWERGAATPELQMLAKLADIFCVSLDALVGFQLQNSTIETVTENIRELQRQKRFSEAAEEAEKALLRYPNNFQLVYCCGNMYACAGIEKNEETWQRRAILLLEQSIALLPQNRDEEINEMTIQSEIARCHLILGNVESGLRILKKYNVDGVHNALIALTYTTNDSIFDSKSAQTYLVESFGGIITSTIRTMLAYANYYDKTKDTAGSREALLWLIHFLESIKENQKQVAFVDKVTAPCYGLCAAYSFHLGEQENTKLYLKKAFTLATNFDASPTYKMNNIKFCVGDIKNATSYDDLGESALESVEKQLDDETDAAFWNIWKDISQRERKKP